jgi:predicted HicB family RNase H-like nuclease
MSENKGADGRPRTLTNPTHFRVRFDGDKLKEAQEWCREREISFNSFVRKAVNELLKRVKGTG